MDGNDFEQVPPEPEQRGPDRGMGDAAFLVVGLGASAGGIEALQVFFSHVPADSGIAYVVIVHLSPDHDSQLASILQMVIPIPVTQVTEQVQLEPNHVYVVPPSQHLLMVDGSIAVLPTTTIEERRAPVDLFFRTLAESHGARAVGVVLSGTGANGSMGLKRIKERGGAVFVQAPNEAAYDEMPRNAIATNLVDEVLPIAALPNRIITYGINLATVTIPVLAEERSDDQQQALREVLLQLRLRTSHDFSNYKRPTLLRRIERRLSVHNLPDLPTYAAFLKEHPEEAQALLKDLLISVTNFFRDKAAFVALEQEIVPHILRGKTAQDEVRVWVAGCATGEEPYSLAMLLAERTFDMLDAPRMQIFATDVDEAALAYARQGLYTLNDAADVSPERLRRFFTPEGNSYRIRREIRELVLFANHNLLKDPPFSHLDLASCRNVLIYLNRAAQERVLETLHFALDAGGYLMLGTSETVDSASDLFTPVSREHHLFQSRPHRTRSFPVPESVSVLRVESPLRVAERPREQEPRVREQSSFGHLHLRLLEQYAPPSVVINEHYEIVHLSSQARRYLQFPSGGEPSHNLLTLIRPELGAELRNALYQAVQRQTNVDARNLSVRTEGSVETINILIRPVLREDDPARGFVLVVFEPNTEVTNNTQQVVRPDVSIVQQLEAEITRLQEQLRTSNDQHTTHAEELKAANEELQALNEELRSAAEELVTSREELQSINEELRTVNQELKIKVEETTQARNNLQNLVNSTNIGTIFLDRAFRVALFTPAVTELFNLIRADYGRPLSDITHHLVGLNVLADAETVLSSLQPIEREVRTVDQRVFLMRVQPYRTDNDHIAGVVLTFLDITERTRAEEAVSSSETKYRTLFESMSQGFGIAEILVGQDGQPTDYRMLEINPQFERLTGQTREQFLTGQTVREIAPELEEEWYQFYGDVGLSGTPAHREIYAAVWNRWFEVDAYRTGAPAQRRVAILYTEITERKRAEAALRESEERQAFLLTLSDALRDLGDPIEVQATASRVLGEHLGADRAYYVEIDKTNKEFVVAHDWHQPGAPSYVRRYPIENWPMPWLTNGKTWVVRDVDTDSVMPGDQRASYRENHIGACIVVPLNKEGRLVAMLVANQQAPRSWTPAEVALVEETAERTWAAVERAKAEAALRVSEVKYRTLFETMDEGFTVCSVVRDDTGRVVDLTYLELNQAVERQTGVERHVFIGRRLSEVFTKDDVDWWLPVYARVADIGEPVTAENYAKFTNRWYELTIYRSGEDELSIFVRDISERKRREANLAFLADISQDLVRLNDIGETMNRLSAKIGTHFNLSHCWFVELDTQQELGIVNYGWQRAGTTTIPGSTHRISDFLSAEFVRKSRAGETIVVRDTAASPFADTEKFAGLGIHSFVTVPFVRDGEWRFWLGLYSSEAHDWREDELELIGELTTRIWTRLERAHAEEALRESEARFRKVFTNNMVPMFVWTPEGETKDANDAFLDLIGYTREDLAAGKCRWDELTPPELRARDLQALAEVEAQGFCTPYEKQFRHKEGYAVPILVGAGVFDYNKDLGVCYAIDLTESKRAEAALRESEQRLRTLLENLPGGAAFIVDRELRYILAEGEALRAVGATPEQYIGKTIYETLDPELVAGYEMRYLQALNGEAFFHEHQISNRSFVSRGIPLRNAYGDIYAVLVVSYDITERRKAEQALRDGEARFRTLADTVPQVIWTNDADGRANYFNERWYDYSGLSLEQSVGPGWQAIVHQDDAPASRERWQRALAAGEAFETEYRLLRADGIYRWFIGRNVPLRDDHGQIVGWFGSATDIEDLKQAEAARRESEERFRLLVEGARDYAMFLLDLQHCITFWSSGAERVFGYTEAEALGQNGIIIFTPEDRAAGQMEREIQTALTEGSALDRRWHLRKDGTRLFLDGALIRLNDEAGKLRGFVKIGRNATAQHEAEQALQQAHDTLERRVEERTAELLRLSTARQNLLQRLVTAQEDERQRLARDLHDSLGQYLSALTLRLSTLEGQAEYLPELRGGLSILRQLARQIDSELDRLTMELRPPALEDLGLAEALHSYTQEWIATSGVPVDFIPLNLALARLPTVVETTAYRIVQEALTNVLKHAQASQVSIIIERRSTTLRVVIEDDGVGFERGAHTDAGTGGRHVGLINMAERAALAGGELTIESTPGSGTTVFLNIPLSTELPKDDTTA